MAAALKGKGIDEIDALKKRVRRQYALGRITKGDNDNLLRMLDDLEAYVIRMPEEQPVRLRKRFL